MPSRHRRHIPLWEYEDALREKHQCFGVADDGITPTISNTGLFAALEAAPEVQAVFVGHNHCNDFSCSFGDRAIDLCFGRHSGYGGYDCTGYMKGSRIITFKQGPSGGGGGGGGGTSNTVGRGNFSTNWSLSTHVRMNSGVIIHPGVLV